MQTSTHSDVNQPVGSATTDPFAGLTGIVHTSKHYGYKFKIPPGYSVLQDRKDGFLLAGIHNGANALIIIGVIKGVKPWNDVRVLEVAKQFAKSQHGLHTFIYEYQVIQGARRLAASCQTPAGKRVAFVVFVDKRMAYVLGYATSASVFESAESLMTEIAERRFQLP